MKGAKSKGAAKADTKLAVKSKGAEKPAPKGRQTVFLFAPLLDVAAMLLYMGSVSLDGVPRIISRPAPGSMYCIPQLYARLRADMDADNVTDANLEAKKINDEKKAAMAAQFAAEATLRRVHAAQKLQRLKSLLRLSES